MYIQTVKGKISPELSGVTLMHEHLLWNDPPDDSALSSFRDDPGSEFLFEKVSCANRTDLMYCAHLSTDNMMQTDVKTAADELVLFKRLGGATVVDVSSAGLYRDPCALNMISEKTGVHIVMATGAYCESRHPACFNDMTAVQMAELFIGEITDGAENTGIKCGIIGEMGISSFGEREKTAMTAAGYAQCETGAAVTTHIDYYERNVEDALDVLQKSGCDPEKIILGHADRWWNKIDILSRFLDRGAAVEFDTFGSDFILGHSICYPNDCARIEGIRTLLDKGYINQLILGHDTFCKIQLYRYGGGGYGHILRHVLPVMKNKGFTDQEIEAMIVHNPKRLLSISK